MTGYTLQIFKLINGYNQELFKKVEYPGASGTEMMDVIYGARHYGIANYFNLPQENVYDVDFVRLGS
jgi:hypothetical protein